VTLVAVSTSRSVTISWLRHVHGENTVAVDVKNDSFEGPLCTNETDLSTPTTRVIDCFSPPKYHGELDGEVLSLPYNILR
jgi:hypothetical protein